MRNKNVTGNKSYLNTKPSDFIFVSTSLKNRENA